MKRKLILTLIVLSLAISCNKKDTNSKDNAKKQKTEQKQTAGVPKEDYTTKTKDGRFAKIITHKTREQAENETLKVIDAFEKKKYYIESNELLYLKQDKMYASIIYFYEKESDAPRVDKKDVEKLIKEYDENAKKEQK